MSEQDQAPAAEDSRTDEYVELVQLIVHTPWHPGDTVRTATGATWQFRADPYTAEFPEGGDPQMSGQTRVDRRLRW